MELDSFLWGFVVGFCVVKYPTEELYRDTLRLPRSCWNSLVQWILLGFFLLSVHCMTSVKSGFSFRLLFQVGMEFCPNSSQVKIPAFISAVWLQLTVAVQMYRKKSSTAFEQLKFKTLLVIRIYLPGLTKWEWLFMKCFYHGCRLILQNIHVLDCGCEILMPY